MLPSTTERVPESTSDCINEKIRRRTEAMVYEAVAAGPHAVDQRIAELDEEWDIERTLEANAASVAFIGVGLGALVDKRFLILSAAVAAFLFQHSLQGWCPPVPVFRRLGFRTQTEIEEERNALKAYRGDYLGSVQNTEMALKAARTSTTASANAASIACTG